MTGGSVRGAAVEVLEQLLPEPKVTPRQVQEMEGSLVFRLKAKGKGIKAAQLCNIRLPLIALSHQLLPVLTYYPLARGLRWIHLRAKVTNSRFALFHNMKWILSASFFESVYARNCWTDFAEIKKKKRIRSNWVKKAKGSTRSLTNHRRNLCNSLQRTGQTRRIPGVPTQLPCIDRNLLPPE